MDKVVLIARRAVFVAGVATLAGGASAHPVHEVVQNAYLTVTPGAVRLRLELTAGPQVAGRIIRALDTDGDRRIGPAEARAFADRVLASSRLTVDGRRLALRRISVAVPYYAALLGAHGTVGIVATAARTDRLGAFLLVYRNDYRPAESRCDANVFFEAAKPVAYRLAAQERSRDGRELRVRVLAARG